MRYPRTRYFALASAQLLAACVASAAPISLPHSSALPAESRSDITYTYEACDSSFARDLRAACRDCDAIEFSTRRRSRAHGLTPFSRLVPRAELATALDTVASIETWYARRTPSRMSVGIGNAPLIRFLDAEGQELFRVSYVPACNGFAHDGSRYISLWEIFGSYLTPTTVQ